MIEGGHQTREAAPWVETGKAESGAWRPRVGLTSRPLTFLHIQGGGAVTMPAAVGFPIPQDRSRLQ